MHSITDFTISATENFFLHTLQMQAKVEARDSAEEIYTTLITLCSEDVEYHFFLCMHESMLQKMAAELLFEDNPDQDTMIDLLNESANLIIGNAKVLWEESEPKIELKLTTPQYQGYFEKNFSKEFDQRIFLKAEDEAVMIGIKAQKMYASV